MLCFCILSRAHHPPLYLPWKWFVPSFPIQLSCPNYLYQRQYCTIYSYHFVLIKIISLFISLHPNTGLPVSHSRGYLTATQLWEDILVLPGKPHCCVIFPVGRSKSSIKEVLCSGNIKENTYTLWMCTMRTIVESHHKRYSTVTDFKRLGSWFSNLLKFY